jgi:integrase
MASRQGTIVKKCKCANKTRCPHKWTLRYWADGRQRERSFADELDAGGRPRYGSGKRLAEDFRLKVAHDKRARIFVDPKLGSERFADACETWISRRTGADSSKATYRSVLRAHVAPALGDRTLAAVAQSRDAVTDLLFVRMRGLSASRRQLARALIVGVLDEAVAAGKITARRATVTVPGERSTKHSDFVFPTHEQLVAVAEAAGLAVWLMRGCGLRISEALAVQRSCFRENGTVLRVFEQAAGDGRGTLPLKHRKPGESRDIPVPSYVWDKIKDLPDGYLFAGPDGRLARYATVWRAFTRAAADAGIPDGFTPHSLRHAFASALLARGVPITDLAAWLGHRDVNVTFGTYGHLVPSAAARAQAALDAEYGEWRNAT